MGRSTLLVQDLIDAMQVIAPSRYAETWDNVGLLAGNPRQRLTGVLLTIDYTASVATEAKAQRCNAVVSYHPPIFAPLKRIAAGSVLADALRRGVALYSPHTALDVAEGGTNDLLADALGLNERAPLRLIEPQAEALKLVTFVPNDHVETVSEALFAAGAGRIGEYTRCSFRAPGVGTFFGEKGTQPTVGQAGQLEIVDEIRVETVVPLARVADVLKALRQAHPYEEPAFDLVRLAGPPEKLGQGRIGPLPPQTDRAALIRRIKRFLKLDKILVAGPARGPAGTAACCAGACGDLLNDAMARKADVYLTGEMRHHDALRAAESGMTVLCTLHSNSERAILARLAEKLSQKLVGTKIVRSKSDLDPFNIL